MAGRPLSCTSRNCRAVAVRDYRACLAHLNEDALALHLEKLRAGEPLLARGVRFTQGLLDQVLESLQQAPDGRRILTKSDFRGATFEHRADFSRICFRGTAQFGRARFFAKATFTGAEFDGDASFIKATFHSDASFVGAVFRSRADFKATFGGEMDFVSSDFSDHADFATVNGGIAIFSDTVFRDRANFSSASFDAANGPALLAQAFAQAFARGTLRRRQPRTLA